MKRKVLLFFLFLCLPIFILSIFMVNVEANEPNGEKAIQVALAGDVDQNGAPVLTNDVGTVQITESTSIYGNTNGLSSEANEGYSFAFYLENNFVISTNPNYTFRTTEDHNFIAFFRPVAKKQVLVVDANNKYLGSMLVDEGTILQTTDLDKYHAQIKAKPGYQFEKWDAVFPLTVEKDFTIIRATYKTINNEIFTVNIYSDGEALIDTKEVNYGKTTTITAPTVEGKAFSHWTVDGQVMSYNNTHTFSVYGPVNVQAVYSEEEVNPVGVSYLSKTTVSDESVMYFILQTFVPTGYSVIEQGMIYKDSAVELAENILIGDEGISRTRAIRISPNSEFAISLNTLNNHLLYVRGYLVIADEGGNTEVIYSDQLVRQFKYNINYHLDGGVNHASNKVYYSVYELPVNLNAPTKTGSNFKGWYLTSNFAGEAVTEISTIGDVNLYAKWEDISYDITYELNGGTWNYPNKETMIKAFFVDLYTYINPTEDFDTFVHGVGKTTGYEGLWTTETRYTNKLYINENKQVDASLKIFINDPLYHVKWMPFFNLIEQLMIERGSVEQGSFWESASTGRARIRDYSKNATFTAEQLARLPNFNPTITSFNVNSSEITLSIPKRAGYSFEGWYETTDFSSPKVTTIPTGSTGNKIYYAKWVIYTITYNLDGGTLETEVNNYTPDKLPIILPTPIKEGFIFDGWYSDSEFKGNPITKINYGEIGNKVYYAKWITEVPNTIRYIYNDGVLAYQTKEEAVNDYINDLKTYIGDERINDLKVDVFMGITSREGYPEKVYAFFEDSQYKNKWGWLKSYILSIANNENYQYKDELIAGNTTYWRANIHGFINNNKYTHPIDPKIYSIDFGNYHLANDFWYRHNGPKTYTTAQGSIDLGTPTRTGYNFIGWYENEDYTGTPLTNIPTGRSGTIILYAKWE